MGTFYLSHHDSITKIGLKVTSYAILIHPPPIYIYSKRIWCNERLKVKVTYDMLQVRGQFGLEVWIYVFFIVLIGILRPWLIVGRVQNTTVL